MEICWYDLHGEPSSGRSHGNEKIIKKPHSFNPRSLLSKLQQEVLKFNDICVEAPQKLIW